MKKDKLDGFLLNNAELLYDECNEVSQNHRDKFALKLGAATRPKWYAIRLERVLCAAVLLIGVFLIQNHRIDKSSDIVEVDNYAEVANYYIGGVNARIDSLIKKAESLDKESTKVIIEDLIQIKEENYRLVRKDPKYNVSAFEATVIEVSRRQNEALNSLEMILAKNN